jgi:uncharacterized protein DUF3810
VWRRLTLVVLAIVLAWAPTPTGVVERLYSTGIYPVLQRTVTRLSNYVPFALFDVLIAVTVVLWLTLAVRDVANRAADRSRDHFQSSPAGRIAVRTVVWGAVFYLLFLVTWGLNYRRTPMAERLAIDPRAVTESSVRELALTAVGQVNALYAAARSGSPAVDDAERETLAAALSRADLAAGGAGAVTIGRPKTTLLDWYLRRTATDGLTDPYFLETLVSTSLLPFERPFVFAHEWSHLAGVADEGDANFLAWLACMYASPAARYSGWLFLYSELNGVLPRETRAEIAARLEPGPRADLAAIRERVIRQMDPRLAAAGRRVYDQYLKANRVEAGIESYGRVVQLVLGARFGPDWELEGRK